MSAMIAELTRKREHVATQMHVLLDTVEKEERAISSDESEKLASMESEYDRLCGKILSYQQKEKEELALAKELEEQRKALPSTRQTTPNNIGAKGGDGVDALETAQNPWVSFGEQLSAVWRAGNKDLGYQVDPRLKLHEGPTGSHTEAGSEGGFLVQQQYSAEIMRRMYEIGRIMSRVREIGIGAQNDSLVMNAVDETSRATGSRFGGIQIYRKGQGDQGTASRPKLRQIKLTLKKLIGLWYATDELLVDATAMESLAMAAFPEEFAFVNEDEIINGDGAAQMLGILNSGCLVTQAAETGQGATVLTYRNLVDMWARMWARSRLSSVWLINQELEPYLATLDFPTGTGGVPVYLPPGGLSASPYSTLFGRPMIPVEYCAAPGTVGDILLADFSQYITITKGGLLPASSMHLRFDYDETVFRWTMRNDGQPIWNSALTPYKGSNTLSPFVALATRS